MNEPTRAQQLVTCVLLVIKAGLPEPKETSNWTQEEREKYACERFSESWYQDRHIIVDMWPDCREADLPEWEVSVCLPDDHGEAAELVLNAWIPEGDNEYPYANYVRSTEIELFQPGPWCEHLKQAAMRASHVLDSRRGST